ncbi:MAG TPA: archease [Pseudomonadales bacterium]
MADDPPSTGSWAHFDHAADMGIRAVGETLADVLVQTALGMTAVVTDQPVRAERAIDIRCQAPDAELLLVDWLNAIIFEMATRRMLFGRFDVRVQPLAEGFALEARAWGEPVERSRHQPAVELKGATYTALDVHQEVDGGWVAHCVVDV